MVVNQIYQLLNDTAEQCFGVDAVGALDLENMLALRETVSAFGSDKFLNALVDRIGKTVIRTLDFTATFPNFLMNEYEFGCVLQKINVAPFDAKAQNAWNAGDPNFVPNQFTIDKANIAVDYFQTSNAWEIDVTIPDVMFKTAFTSAEAMDAFITAIFDSVATSLNMQLENETRLAILGFIGEKIHANNGIVDVLALYNAECGTGNEVYDADVAKNDPRVLKFVGKLMRNYISYLRKPSVLYNTAGRVRATSRDNMHVMVLTEFMSAYTTYLSETFHNELVELPYYTEVEYWQGTGDTAPNFADCSSIDIKIPSDGTAVQESGIIAVFADREAIGTGLFDRFSAVDRNNRNRYTNYTEGCTIQSFVDTSESGIVFILKDQTPPTP